MADGQRGDVIATDANNNRAFRHANAMYESA